jgi:hypothetical protein
MAIRTLNQLATAVDKDQQLEADLKSDPKSTLAKLATQIPDTWVYRSVVWFLGITALTTAVGSLILASNGNTPPEGVIALGSAGVGALAGLLAPSPTA